MTRAIEALLTIMNDPEEWIGQRMKAAANLLEYEAPVEASDAAKAFLTEVSQDLEYDVDFRIEALKLLRKAEARRVTSASVPATPGITPADIHLWKGLRMARRRAELKERGLWPAPEGWADDIENDTPPPDIAGCAGSSEGWADRLKEARRRYEEQRRIHGPDWRG